MDVLTLDRNRITRLADGSDDQSRLGRLRRRWRAWIDAARDDGPAGAGPGAAAATDARRILLLAYTGGQIALGLALLAWVTIRVDIWPGIASDQLGATALEGTTGGVLLWTMFGLLGSVRTVSSSEGSGHFTFHLPFVGAAMILGGPTAGAWVAFLSTIDRRELESQPWYGILANHTAIVIAAVAGGATYALVSAGVLGATGDAGIAAFVAILLAGLVLEGIANALALVTYMIRDRMSAAGGIGLLVDDFRRETILEVALIWVLVLATGTVGWWAPLIVGIGVIALVPRERDDIDPLTGFIRRQTFERKLDRKVGWMRLGFLPGGTVFYLDLNGFHLVNNQHGHDVGDEVLKVVAARIREACPRHEDLVSRLMGDEFAILFAGLTSPEVALRKAQQLIESVCRPVPTSVGPVHVGVAVGVHVTRASGAVPSAGTLLRWAEQAMYIAKAEGGPCGAAHLHQPGERSPFDGEWGQAR
jgi:diguanylate cyclase (GGDEF)-like protein